MTRFARHLGVGGAVHDARARQLRPELPPVLPLWRKVADGVAAYLAVVIALLLLLSFLAPE